MQPGALVLGNVLASGTPARNATLLRVMGNMLARQSSPARQKKVQRFVGQAVAAWQNTADSSSPSRTAPSGGTKDTGSKGPRVVTEDLGPKGTSKADSGNKTTDRSPKGPSKVRGARMSRDARILSRSLTTGTSAETARLLASLERKLRGQSGPAQPNVVLKAFVSDLQKGQGKGKLARSQSAGQAYRQFLEQLQKQRAGLKSDLETHNLAMNAHKAECTSHKEEVADYDRAIQRYRDDKTTHERHVRAFNKENAEYTRDVKPHNSLPALQRSQSEYNRLTRWKARLDKLASAIDSSKAQLDVRSNALHKRFRTINSRAVRLNARSAELQSGADQLNSRIKDLYDVKGQKLQELRQAAKKEAREAE